ncbi:hypothetical protein [Sinimarinibacterium sp. NLF-5-8]|uniref:hypothetical protein n=1 Tax=Sinimarinibacterium sp. NLF-5-8 TaxID=2698684 RepID=UPI00137BC588|nr:hypothetical protein [Sinimarinibacterium sp. NLF-5-8]QHS10857.1 hypothetical protein GT972_12370 [Sinimarinibacterium sp. NLF-5-8]
MPSIDPAVTSAVMGNVQLQQASSIMSAQTTVFNRALDIQEQTIGALIGSVAPTPELATEGDVGTQLHVVA